MSIGHRVHEERHLQQLYDELKPMIIQNNIPFLWDLIARVTPPEQLKVIGGLNRVYKFFFIAEPNQTPRVELYVETVLGHDMIIYLNSVVCGPVPGVSNLPFRTILGSVTVHRLQSEKDLLRIEHLIEEAEEEELAELKLSSFEGMMERLVTQ